MKAKTIGAMLLLVAFTVGGGLASGQAFEQRESSASATIGIPVLRGIGGGFEGRSVPASGEVVEARFAIMVLDDLIVTAQSIRVDAQSRRVEAVGNVVATLRANGPEITIRAETISIEENP
jgi:hypothetical protein